MFDDTTQALIAALQQIAGLRFVPPTLVVAEVGAPGAQVEVDNGAVALGSERAVAIPVHRPDPADPSGDADYLPLSAFELQLVLRPRVLIADPGDGSYDAATVAFACAHALAFTDGALADFMAAEHPLVFGGPGAPPNPSAFEWAAYRLDTLLVESIGPGETAAMQLSLRLDGIAWLYPATAPAAIAIQDVECAVVV